MPSAGDDRLHHAVPFILERFDDHQKVHRSDANSPPLILGLNGVQGCGKSTLVDRLQEILSQSPHFLHIAVFSVDDLYLPHDRQVALALAHPDNPLVQHRGEPSTHDVELGKDILDALRANKSTEIPIYDKSAFNGQGDRVKNRTVKVDVEQRKLDLVIFEGWFNGFRALSNSEARSKWERARELAASDPTYQGRLGHNEFASIDFINSELRRYDVLTDRFDALIHIDAEDTHFVYDWRLEAEQGLRERTGSGMTDEQVKIFVDGYYPAYELYTEKLREGTFPGQSGRQLRLVVGKDRKVIGAHRL